MEKVKMWELGVMIHGYRLELTCGACPEQYDVYDSLGQQVAYFRLRHGTFRVDVPDCGGETIYTANPEGDGIFTRDERVRYLTEAVLAVQEFSQPVQSFLEVIFLAHQVPLPFHLDESRQMPKVGLRVPLQSS